MPLLPDSLVGHISDDLLTQQFCLLFPDQTICGHCDEEEAGEGVEETLR